MLVDPSCILFLFILQWSIIVSQFFSKALSWIHSFQIIIIQSPNNAHSCHHMLFIEIKEKHYMSRYDFIHYGDKLQVSHRVKVDICTVIIHLLIIAIPLLCFQMLVYHHPLLSRMISRYWHPSFKDLNCRIVCLDLPWSCKDLNASSINPRTRFFSCHANKVVLLVEAYPK